MGFGFHIELLNERADSFPHRHTHYIATGVQIENENRKLIVAAHGDSRCVHHAQPLGKHFEIGDLGVQDRKSTRLNSSHSQISYAVFCLKKKKITSRLISWSTPT